VLDVAGSGMAADSSFDPRADPTSDPSTGEWYWDLKRQRAVPAAERGAADHVLGPYASRAAAEHWRDRVEVRNEAWDDDDERWEGRTGDDRPARDL
jgi:hypothetical protein